MKFTRGKRDEKSLNVEVYDVILNRDSIEPIISKLLSGIDSKNMIMENIKDNLIEDYIKLIVVDEANKQNLLTRGSIVKINIITDVDTIVCMTSLHDKIEKIFF